MTAYSWKGPVGNDLWSNASNWTPSGGPPGINDSVLIAGNGYSIDVTGISAAGSLNLGLSLGTPIADTLTVDNGGNFDIGAGSTIYSGTLVSDVGANLYFYLANTFTNESTVLVGQILSAAGGNSNLEVDGSMTLTGGGTVDLGQVSSKFQAASTGTIEDQPTTTGALINNNNTINGGGLISVSTFDNQASGKVNATQSEQFALQISSSTFTNEGMMTAQDRATLQLGKDGATRSMSNTGSVLIEGQGNLAISGNYTITGGGDIAMEGASGNITSDGAAAATFVNETFIEETSTGQIGDPGVQNANDLTFDNAGGTAVVSGLGDVLTLNTGSHTITDNDGGSLGAVNTGQLIIDSNVDTGGVETILGGHVYGGGGTIDAAAEGLVTINSAIAPGGTGFQFKDGQILIAGGTVEFAAGSSDTTPINFSGPGGTLQLDSETIAIPAISGAAARNFVDERFMAFGSTVTGAVSQNGTSGTLTVSNTSTSYTLSFDGLYSFSEQNDGTGKTLVEFLNPVMPNDFTANGTSDVLLANGSGAVIDWIMHGGVYQSYNSVGSAGSYGALGTGDFNGDHTTDVLLQDGSGNMIDWLMNNGIYSSYDSIGNANNAGYGYVKTGDFSGNGTSDILLENGSGNLIDWMMNNGAYQSYNDLGNSGGYGVVGVGDFSGNGTSDILMQNSSGAVIDWMLNNGGYRSYNNLGNPASSGYGIVGTGDFNGDGTTDLMLENAGGNVIDWIMQNGQYAGWNEVGNTGGYGIVDTGDYNGSGTTGILLENASGNLIDWTMQNGMYTGYNNLGSASGYGVIKSS
jgi:hypothetical protein